MKLLLALLVSLQSAAVFSGVHAVHNQYFSGSGVVIHPDGSAVRYLASLSISKQSANKFHLHYDKVLGDKNMFFDLVYVHDKPDASFFSIYMDDMLVGHGYCWGMKCHTNWSHHGYNIEHTYRRHRRSGAIHGMGSKRGEDGMVYIWKEKLQPFHSLPDDLKRLPDDLMGK